MTRASQSLVWLCSICPDPFLHHCFPCLAPWEAALVDHVWAPFLVGGPAAGREAVVLVLAALLLPGQSLISGHELLPKDTAAIRKLLPCSSHQGLERCPSPCPASRASSGCPVWPVPGSMLSPEDSLNPPGVCHLFITTEKDVTSCF